MGMESDIRPRSGLIDLVRTAAYGFGLGKDPCLNAIISHDILYILE